VHANVLDPEQVRAVGQRGRELEGVSQ
jgi:hypothetical protein